MAATADNGIFRAQLVIPEQHMLYDYWLSRHGVESLPSRADINPCHIGKLLPGISLIDVAAELPQSRVRLAGTRLREIYDREITGLRIEDLDWGGKRNYWLAAFRRTVEERQPTQGVVVGPCSNKDHLVQYWLRLPLCDATGSINMILSFVYFIPVSERAEHLRLAVG